MNRQTFSKYGHATLRTLCAFALAASFGALAQSSSPSCGSLRSSYGPFDYRTNRGETLDLVERFHFTPEVEGLIRGRTSDNIGADLSYTLGTFPNHHRALMSMMLFGEKLKTPQPPYAAYSVECYFLRALRFRPDDITVHLMYANYLARNARIPDAIRELEQVSKAAGDNPFTHYNMGLIYIDMKEYEKALTSAHKAMALGLPRTELRDKLAAAGKWRDPEVSLSTEQPSPALK